MPFVFVVSMRRYGVWFTVCFNDSFISVMLIISPLHGTGENSNGTGISGPFVVFIIGGGNVFTLLVVK